MKAILFKINYSILGLLLLVTCSPSFEETFLINEDYSIYGSKDNLVKSFEQISYKCSSNGKKLDRESHFSFDQEFDIDQYVEFDSLGYIVKRTTLNENSKYNSDYIYSYNTSYELTKIEQKQDGKLIFYTVFPYTHYISKLPTEIRRYYCYGKNQEDLDMLEKRKFFTVGDNIKFEVFIRNYSAGFSEKKYFIINSDNIKIEEGFYNDYGALSGKILFNYEGYNLIEKQYLSDGEIQWTKKYLYDEHGNMIDNGDYQWEYKYDKYKNWIEKVHIVDGKPKYITERKYVYY